MIGVGAVAAFPRGRCAVLVVGRFDALPDPDRLEAALADALAASDDHENMTGFRKAVWRRLRTALPGFLTITTEWFPPSLAVEVTICATA